MIQWKLAGIFEKVATVNIAELVHIFSLNHDRGRNGTVDGSEIRRENQLRLVAYPTIYQGFIHPRWLSEVTTRIILGKWLGGQPYTDMCS